MEAGGKISSMQMNDKEVPYIVYESTMARMERTIHRLWTLAVLLVILLVGTNIAWICYEGQYEDVSVTQDVETGNGSAFVRGISYGENTSDG